MTLRHLQGSGMTSQRTRDRMTKRLIEQGITDNRVLNVIQKHPVIFLWTKR